jgi:ADP-heptose:LPS heptosyltransferase
MAVTAATDLRRPALVVLRALGLGDFLTAVPALRALADAFPGHRRLLAAPRPLAPLAALSGAVDATVPVGPLASLPRCVDDPDVAVNLHGRGPQSHRILLATRPRRLIAFAHPAVPATAGSPTWRDDEHEAVRWCRLLEEEGVPADPSRLFLARPSGPAPPEAAGATIIHPGAASPARRWPARRWGAVARAETEAGRRVLVTAGPGEQALAEAVVATAGADICAVAAPADLSGLAALVAAADRVACGDTGVAHLATALGTPSVVVFGPTPPARWGPPADRPIHRVLWAGWTGPPDGPVPDSGLLAITVGDVIAALATLPVRSRAPAGLAG